MADASPPMFDIVVAATRAGGIGLRGALPWHLPSDMAFFRSITSTTTSANGRNCVIMGRKTWDSIPAKFRPLPNRLNVVLSRNGDLGSSLESQHGMHNVRVVPSFPAALELVHHMRRAASRAEPPEPTLDRVFVIGGSSVIKEALAHPLCDGVHWTTIHKDIECDTFISPLSESEFRLAESFETLTENDITFQRHLYRHRNVQELQYLNLIQEILQSGDRRSDRTGVGTMSRFGCQMRFDLRYSFPLLTTKRVFWRGVAEELLWFISGNTDGKVLSAKGIKIWDGNGSREYLDKIGLSHREEGDLGPVYGFQWRHFGAEYRGTKADYTGQGVDQLAAVIHAIRTNPTDRRIIMSAWNPADLSLMALPPCHMFCQFYVAGGRLSCLMYQRSCDMGLGVPFNIASYALLTYMIAHVCDLEPGEFIHTLGDAHVYLNHIEPLQEQLQREPRAFPTLRIKRKVHEIDDFCFDDFELVGYNPYGTIKMEMAV